MKAWLVKEPYERYRTVLDLEPPEQRAEVIYARTRGRAITLSDLYASGWGFTDLIARRLPDLDADVPEGWEPE